MFIFMQACCLNMRYSSAKALDAFQLDTSPLVWTQPSAQLYTIQNDVTTADNVIKTTGSITNAGTNNALIEHIIRLPEFTTMADEQIVWGPYTSNEFTGIFHSIYTEMLDWKVNFFQGEVVEARRSK